MLAIVFILFARDQGCTAKAFRCEDAIEVIVEGMPKDDVKAFLQANSRYLAPNGGEAAHTIVELVGAGLADRTANEIRHTKLTKSLLFSLAEGAWIMRSEPNRVWIKNVAADTDRQTLWEQATASRIAYLKVYILWREQDALAMANFFKLDIAVAWPQLLPSA